MTRISKAVCTSNIAHWKINFISLGIPAEESVYFKNGKSPSGKIFKYGNANGPNSQFFGSFDAIISNYTFGPDETCLLLEVDAIPLRDGWLQALESHLERHKSFLIAGATAYDKGKLNSLVRNHINGNAAYSIGSKVFVELLQEWRRLLELITDFNPSCCYDVAMCFYEEYARLGLIDGTSYPLISDVWNHVVDISPFMMNINSLSELSDEEVSALFESRSVVVHSKSLMRYMFNKAAARS